MISAIVFGTLGTLLIMFLRGYLERDAATPNDLELFSVPDLLVVVGITFVWLLALFIYKGVFWQVMGLIFCVVVGLIVIDLLYSGLVNLGRLARDRHND